MKLAIRFAKSKLWAKFSSNDVSIKRLYAYSALSKSGQQRI